MMIVKEFDYSSPYLYKAVATGQALQKAELKFYKINDAGLEAGVLQYSSGGRADCFGITRHGRAG